MGRTPGSKNKPKGTTPGIGHNSNGDSVNAQELRSYVERIESLNEQQKEIASDRTEVFKEAKSNGYDVDVMKAIILRRKMDPGKRETMDAVMDMYNAALGDYASTELGVAGAERLRGEARVGNE